MGKNTIRLTESQLHNLIKESVMETLNELRQDTVDSTMKKMKEKGAKERARNIGKLAANNYGGKELAAAGYEYDGKGGMAKSVPVYKRNKTDKEMDLEKEYSKKSIKNIKI